MNRFQIAGYIIELQFAPEFIHPYLFDFTYEGEQKSDITYSLECDQNIREKYTGSEWLATSENLNIRSTSVGYDYVYSNNEYVALCSVDVKLWRAVFTIEDTQNYELHKEHLFIAIRDMFFIFLQQNGFLTIHSSSIIYREKTYLFSASSGTGKTTHTDLWRKYYNVPILNGDVTVVGIEDHQPIAYGIPWCGTSHQYLNRRLVLGGIIFLQQGQENYINNLSPRDTLLRLLAHTFNPNWTKTLISENLSIAEAIQQNVKCALLTCRPDVNAMNMAKNYIDNLQNC